MVTTSAVQRNWPSKGSSKIPFWVYSDPDIYAQELEKIFYGPHWSYVGLEAEVPNKGDFKTTNIGERAVIITRADDGEIYVVENRCAHRGVKFCRKKLGNTAELVCPYHQWSYALDGSLLGVPLMRGVRRKGGMPQDFNKADHGLTRLRSERVNGVIWATFSDETPDFETYLGPRMFKHYSRVYSGKPLKVLGYNRQRIPANWKLMLENIKDSYHPGLLHVFFATFGLFRADQDSAVDVDDTGMHGILISRKGEQVKNEVTSQIRTFQDNLNLQDPRILDYKHEWDGPDTVGMITVFPSVILQQQVNSLSIRQILPRGPNEFDFIWTHFGYADDDEDMTTRRLRQANLFGPAGLVSADDGEIIEFAQDSLKTYGDSEVLAILGGHDVKCEDHIVTETAIRGMYRYYREIMGL
ncbi:aromatic ring-hydroxylating dioxygenase subunit alpha [Kordiimonas pumila]|uniref:Aromatic ring-hydroxylating dioxygenase subunit alpha n=1 Tax=Kordiimonas pumila TaxID=2161677 RepID=A0ABV7D3Y9_9PROT|nr:aromatic ring-hydroxylating dioxygenase subunit alpha [Kordiimonas pumila]